MNPVFSKSNWFACLAMLLCAGPAGARGCTNPSVAVYFRCQEVHSVPDNLAQFSNQWARAERALRRITRKRMRGVNVLTRTAASVFAGSEAASS